MIEIPQGMLVRPPSMAALAKTSEHWLTDSWAAEAVLTREIMTRDVWDPCCGTGIMSHIAGEYGYQVLPTDLHDWGYSASIAEVDFLNIDSVRSIKMIADAPRFTIFGNPPFSKACQFVDMARQLEVRKTVIYQRWAWWESAKRREWWRLNPPNRIYVCSDRATSWLVTVPMDERVNESGGKKSTPTAHAFFVFEPAHPTGTLVSHISKDMCK